MQKYILYYYSFCPFSRKIRFLLDEIGIEYKKVEIKPYENNKEFVKINPLAETPVLIDEEHNIKIIDSYIIAEYLKNIEYSKYTSLRDEYFGSSLREELEIDRLEMLFDKNFYNQVTRPLMHEKVFNSLTEKRKFCSPTKMNSIISNMNILIEYMEYILTKNKWLAGEKFSLADISGATQISICDYFGHVNWNKYVKLKNWYIITKSKKGFRNILNDKLPGFTAPENYNKLDF